MFEHRNTYGVLLQERSVEERAKFHYYLARAYAKAGMNDRALQYLRKALEEGLKERDKIAEDAGIRRAQREPRVPAVAGERAACAVGRGPSN